MDKSTTWYVASTPSSFDLHKPWYNPSDMESLHRYEAPALCCEQKFLMYVEYFSMYPANVTKTGALTAETMAVKFWLRLSARLEAIKEDVPNTTHGIR